MGGGREDPTTGSSRVLGCWVRVFWGVVGFLAGLAGFGGAGGRFPGCVVPVMGGVGVGGWLWTRLVRREGVRSVWMVVSWFMGVPG